MLETVGLVHPFLHARHAHRRNTARRFAVALVVFELRVGRLQAVAHLVPQRLGRDGFLALPDGLIGEDEDGDLELLGDVERLDRRVETVLDVRAGEDDPRRVAVSPEEALEEVGLLALGRIARRGAAALHVDDDDGNLRHRGQAEHLDHQGKARAGGRRHRLDAGKGRSDDGADRRELVLGLEEGAAGAGHPLGEEVQDLGGGRDRVAREEPAAGVERADRGGFVSGHQEPRRRGRVVEALSRKRRSLGSREFASGSERPRVRFEHGRLLAPEAARHRALERLCRQPEELAEDAERDDVLRAGRPRGRAGDPGKGHRDPGQVLAVDEAEVFARRAILRRFVKNQGVGRHRDLSAEAGKVGPAEDHEHVDAGSLREDLVGGHPHSAGGFAAPDLRPIGLGLDDVESFLRRDLGDEVSQRDDAVSSGSHDPDRDVPGCHGFPSGGSARGSEFWTTAGESHDVNESGRGLRGRRPV